VEKRYKIKEKLGYMSEEKYKQFQENLCPNQEKILGIRIPALREYAKQIVKEDWRRYLEEIDEEFFEEKMLFGFILGYAKMEYEERIFYLKKFVQKIDNWCICDCCVSSFKFIQKNREEFLEMVEEYAKSNKEFENRFALVCLLDYYILPEYLDRIFRIIDEIKSDEYYVSMAEAWLLAELYIKQEKETEKYLKQAKISDITYNRAIQKMLDSYRITKEKKDVLRKRKRKN